ncbi:hypothetical protein WCU79_11630 [Pectobacterium versatile]|uniref:Abi-like protein n=1 Tax=Pectobacterium versatile TaxID=2488639 RepID=A0ABU8JZD8_9GAMM|nr:hypothetical protein [Pectobacterium versatile]MBN3196977.1 hypothetical protein [Pectobacterium versatile]TAI93766.1 hypothetical protein EG335_19470 [Pectobacterium versatile]UCP83421.1 hypothetical protein LGL95_09310 [Pectobacterium versatile]
MSLMRINHVRNEIRKLEAVINNLTKNYHINFKEYDSQFRDVEDFFDERVKEAQSSKNWDALYDINKEKYIYVEPLESLESLAKFQNELMLVKHVALIESMIVKIFWCLTCLLKKDEYKNKYFIEMVNFSDSFEAASKISELTCGMINLKKSKFWYLYETLKTIRNSIAHGDPLFEMSYRRAMKFNSQIDIICLSSEKNRCKYTKNMYPSVLHPTYENKSIWFCCLKSDLSSLNELNSRCLSFVEEVRSVYLKYGVHRGFSTHQIYGCQV